MGNVIFLCFYSTDITERRNDMKNKKILSIVLVCIIVLSVGMLLMWKHHTNYNTTLEANWEISIPSKARYSEIYSKDSGPSFHGDGIRYHIFSYKDHSYVGEMLDWESDEKETLYYGNYSNTVNVWLDTIDVPSEYRPDCSECLFWYNSQDDNSEIIILWDKGNNALYLMESFL